MAADVIRCRLDIGDRIRDTTNGLRDTRMRCGLALHGLRVSESAPKGANKRPAAGTTARIFMTLPMTFRVDPREQRREIALFTIALFMIAYVVRPMSSPCSQRLLQKPCEASRLLTRRTGIICMKMTSSFEARQHMIDRHAAKKAVLDIPYAVSDSAMKC
jgi:hypothetical protein